MNNIKNHISQQDNDLRLPKFSSNKSFNTDNFYQEKTITIREENIIKEIIKENIANLPVINEESESQANTEDLNIRKMEIFKEDIKENDNESENLNIKEQQSPNVNNIQFKQNQNNNVRRVAPLLTNMDKRYEERKQKREELKRIYEEKKRQKELEEQELKRKKDEEEKLKKQELIKQKKIEKQKV